MDDEGDDAEDSGLRWSVEDAESAALEATLDEEEDDVVDVDVGEGDVVGCGNDGCCCNGVGDVAT